MTCSSCILEYFFSLWKTIKKEGEKRQKERETNLFFSAMEDALQHQLHSVYDYSEALSEEQLK